jgi:hypothetical protein
MMFAALTTAEHRALARKLDDDLFPAHIRPRTSCWPQD